MTPEERQRQLWDASADRYDRMVAPMEKRFLAASRRWVGERAVGEVLEVAVGTGLNLPYLPTEIMLTAMDISAPMLAAAKAKAAAAGRVVTWADGDAHRLPFPDDSFDTVLSTYAMCGFADYEKVLAEMVRVVRPNGRILLADHVVSTNVLVRGLQLAVEAVTKRTNGEYWTRRPLPKLERMGVQIVDSDRMHFGVIEHLHARKVVG
ncbi:MAG: class I SAM-dependent methyltransferase [Propionibacteriaceae bacterium]|nr:class I SAM-dependent methyltransferase [Propionibacteriaceae bacterium]